MNFKYLKIASNKIVTFRVSYCQSLHRLILLASLISISKIKYLFSFVVVLVDSSKWHYRISGYYRHDIFLGKIDYREE